MLFGPHWQIRASIRPRSTTDGSINPQGLLTSAFDTLEIRTTATAPIVVNLRGPPSPSAQALIDQFRPQIILSGRAGRFEFAPGGSGDQLDFSRSAMSLGLGLGAAILGVGLLGYALLRR